MFKETQADGCWVYFNKIGLVLDLATIGTGLYQPFKEKDQRSIIATVVLLAVSLVFWCLREFAKSEYILSNSESLRHVSYEERVEER